ncbi:hypothetical protein [Rhodococcoides fascians]|uniref:hypothetical protein n=1 Tax=Rhodococcoides fascians TaxID=1828 RepID=UPI000560E5BE|nr:hypothetical protein [Rhodococcus fascians]
MIEKTDTIISAWQYGDFGSLAHHASVRLGNGYARDNIVYSGDGTSATATLPLEVDFSKSILDGPDRSTFIVIDDGENGRFRGWLDRLTVMENDKGRRVIQIVVPEFDHALAAREPHPVADREVKA